MRQYDWFDKMVWYRRLFLLFTRRRYYYINQEDTHCFVTCSCGEELSASDAWIEYCPKCGRGYSTDFRCFSYYKRSYLPPD